MNRLLMVTLLAFVVATPAPGLAQEPTAVDPDRPNVSTSARTVPPGAVQIETGALYFSERMAGAPAERQFAWEATVRVGLLPALEIRIDGDPFVWQRNDEEVTGLGDLTLSVKWRLLEAAGLMPAVALLPFVKVPVARTPIGTQRVDGGVRGLFSFGLPSSWSIDANAGLAAIGQRSGGHIVQGQASAAASHPLSENLSGFVELVYQSAAERGDRDAFGADFGVTLMLTRRLAVDAAAGATLVGKGPDYAFRVGFSTRFGR
jgi:hypothetical protein